MKTKTERKPRARNRGASQGVGTGERLGRGLHTLLGTTFSGLDTGLLELASGGCMRLIVGSIEIEVAESGKKKRPNIKMSHEPDAKTK